MARPTNYKKEYAEQAYKLCLLGAIDREMADIFGVSEQTFNAWKKAHPELLESIKKGKDEADAVVAERLFKRATGYDHPDIVTASKDGKITDVLQVTKYYPPDTAAAIFWMKNRQKDKWRDKTDLEHSGKIELPNIVITK
jgi:hypothetical protein